MFSPLPFHSQNNIEGNERNREKLMKGKRKQFLLFFDACFFLPLILYFAAVCFFVLEITTTKAISDVFSFSKFPLHVAHKMNTKT
jgi:hypothetical protein